MRYGGRAVVCQNRLNITVSDSYHHATEDEVRAALNDDSYTMGDRAATAADKVQEAYAYLVNAKGQVALASVTLPYDEELDLIWKALDSAVERLGHEF